ncbi:MAG: DHH family phosphoesterase [Atopobiaceae bacterium]|nr:DHH family phosphoesterase [Atopobiaceae bacterium]
MDSTTRIDARLGIQFEELSRLIRSVDTIALCAHTSPDGDAIGSVLGLSQIILSKYPGKKVTCLLADPEPIPAVYGFLPGSDGFVHVSDYPDSPDLFICVDLPQLSRLAEAEEVYHRAKRHAAIDHHPARDVLGEIHIERTDAAAVGVLITRLAQVWGVMLTPEMAQCLLCAIVTDTGRFQFQNANPEAFKVASVLVDAGASPADIALNVYQSFRLEYLKLESIVMGRISTCAGGRIAYSWATIEDIDSCGVRLDECDGLIDIVRSVAGSEIAMFVRETRIGKIRGNLRAKGDQDVSVVAAQLGGGGHRAAAGFSYVGGLDEVIGKALPLLEGILDANDAD